ncbi:hypothetical protein LTR53_018216 [Teratosphaeriaceae sp. CCFEE 6253]|nr:hypothetical protein LTR53_018216 [Teratosphaeriaceae sp. CCFEE 6253]
MNGKTQQNDDDEGSDADSDEEVDEDGEHAEPTEPEPAEPAGASPSSATAAADATPASASSAPAKDDPKPSQQPSKAKSTPLARGKRTKAKKAAQKYAHQDAADRQLALQLLGSQAADARREAETAAAPATESLEEARARRREQHQQKQRAGLEAEELRRLNLEENEGVEAADDDDTAHFTPLDALVGTPLPGDEILDVLPVCAPWAALGKYKYKVKLQPGQQKKGKAIREILGKWGKDAGNAKWIDGNSQDAERIWPREAELLRGMREVDVVGVIPVKSVRVMMGGGAAGGEGGKGKSGGAKQKGGGRGGRGSKKR